MGLRFLIDEIKTSTSQDVSNIRTETRRMQAQMLSDAKQRAGEIVEDGHKQGKELVAREQVAVASAELQAKKIVADARNRLLQQVYDEVKADLENAAGDKRYPLLFKKLAEDAVEELGEDAVLQCNKRDLAMAKKIGKASADLDCSGGAIASSSDGLVRVNNTFEAILEDSEEKIMQKAYQSLFGGEKAKSAYEKTKSKEKSNK